MLNKEYWVDRYQNLDTPWNVNQITTPIKEYIDQIENKNLKILIPGCGNGLELNYLQNTGFNSIFGLDFAENGLKTNKEIKIYVEDFFTHIIQYDLIIEQTFFCALNPVLRKKYVKKMHDLLNANGKLIGLLFQFPLTEKGPPFGGSKNEYIELFSPFFEINILKTAHNSIKPRQNNELFFIFTKK